MTEAMISRLPARRDGTGYAFILRDGLTPVIARPPIIWHGSWYKQFTRRAPAPLPRPACCRQPRPGRTTWHGMTPSRCPPPRTRAGAGSPGRARLARR